MQDMSCACGKEHSLNCKQIVVDKGALSSLFEDVKAYGKRALFITDELGLNEIEGREICGQHINLPSFTITTAFADSLPDKGQDLVVAIGREELISLAKYYAYKFSCELYIYPIGNFADFTFSCFARLYDGIDMGFFVAAEPSKIFVRPPVSQNSLQAYYMSTKFLVMFDNLVEQTIYGNNPCSKMEQYFKSIIKNHLAPCLPEESSSHLIWSLIRLGQGMTYFKETKYFLGAERAVADLLSVIRPNQDYLEMVSVAHKLVINAYCCFFPENPCHGNFNLNKHINALSQLLKVPPSVVISRLSSSRMLSIDENLVKRFISYQPYLKRIFTRLVNRAFTLEAKINLTGDGVKKGKFTLEEIEKCFALSPLTNSRATGMNLILGFGYLDKLL